MSLLIDGYNLLSAAGILGRGVGPGSLQRARLALLNFLAESLQPREIPRTTVVFDAADPLPGLPRTVSHRGLTVRFASQYEDADELIEELIRTDSAPRRLTVVSSDHRLQRAARRRKAQATDSDAWYAQIVRRRQERGKSAAERPARPPVPLLAEDVDYWIRQFGGPSLLAQLIEEESAGPRAGNPPAIRAGGQPPVEGPRPDQTAPDKPTAEEAARIGDPFPPGYADDLLDEDKTIDPENPFPPGYGEDLTGD
jgi:predicted RNA-binding protein with PIN domain